jgi:hypothetical protein
MLGIFFCRIRFQIWSNFEEVKSARGPSTSKVLLTLKLFLSSRKNDLGCSSLIRVFPSGIPDPDLGSRGHKASDPGSGSATLFFVIVMDPFGLCREGAEAYWNSLQTGHTGLSVFG